MESEEKQAAAEPAARTPDSAGTPAGATPTDPASHEGSDPQATTAEAPATPAEARPEAPPEEVDPEVERVNRMLEIQKTMGEAARLSSMKSSTIRGRAFKVRWRDDSMEPVIKRADLLHIGPATLMKLKTGDLLYFHVQEEYKVRRLVRRTAVAEGLAFAVRTESSDAEELVGSNQILGKVVSLERGLETIYIEKKNKPGGSSVDLDTLVEKVAPFVQRVVDKAMSLVDRFRKRKKS